jgi:hypothetical protein
MTMGRRVAAAVVGLLGIALLASPAPADTAAVYLPQGEDLGGRPTDVLLAADRLFGFVPMRVNLSGMVKTEAGDLIPVHAGQKIRLVVESPMLRVRNGDTVTSLVSEMHYEAVTPGPASPTAFRRAIEIRRPGHYLVRVQVIAPDGDVLSSNEVSVRAL